MADLATNEFLVLELVFPPHPFDDRGLVVADVILGHRSIPRWSHFQQRIERMIRFIDDSPGK